MINNWADASLISPQPERRTSFARSGCPHGRFVVCYAGNLGLAHDIETVLSAMTLLQDRSVMSPTEPAAKVMFLFVGGGAKRAQLSGKL